MRVKLTQDNEISSGLRGKLQQAGYAVVDSFYDVEIDINLSDTAPHTIVDGVDSELERHVVTGISTYTNEMVILNRPGPNTSDRKLTIHVPSKRLDGFFNNLEVGILWGVLTYLKNDKRGKLRRLLGLFVVLLCFVPMLRAETAQQVAQITDVKPKSNPILGSDAHSKVRDLQFEQDKLIIRQRTIETEHEKLEHDIEFKQKLINDLVLKAAREQGVDINKFILDLDTLEFVKREEKHDK